MKSKAYYIAKAEVIKDDLEEVKNWDDDDNVIVLKDTPENNELCRMLFGDGIEIKK